MSYETGTVNSFADLLTALRTFCTANGWTLTGTLLSKAACYLNTGSTATGVAVHGGTGYSSGAMTGAGPRVCYLRAPRSGVPIAFPCAYHLHLHTDPDEIYCLVNWSGAYWAWLAFGRSPVQGLAGTGNWYAATTVGDLDRSRTVIGVASGSNVQYNGDFCPAPFWADQNASIDTNSGANSYLHHGLDGQTWSSQVGTGPGGTVAIAAQNVQPMLAASPNSWNGETVLMPIIATIGRGTTKVSVVGQLAHARYVRNDNLVDGQVLTLGPDRWKTYPFYRREVTNRNGGNTNGSGTFGWAVRYDGP